MRSTFACSLLVFALGGCGLTLDYDPPEDGGIDAPGVDASLDAPIAGCQTDLDCADGDLCNGLERCAAGRCEAGMAVACGDGDVCNGIETCEPATGTCVSAPVAACASDGDPCNGEEFCDPVLGCTHGPAPECDDGVRCTRDTCVVGEGCTFSPDDARCDVADDGMCLADGCHYPTCEVGTTCTSDDACFIPRCTPMGMCVREPRACGMGQQCCDGECVPEGCDDGLACTFDRCSPTDGCINAPVTGGRCDDGNLCTGGDTCVSGTCVGGTVRPCFIGADICMGGRCDPSTGECDSAPLDDVPCVDADACTVEDRCVAGRCTSGRPAECDDGEFCTADACDPAMGCSHSAVPDGISCPGVLASICIGGRCLSMGTCPPGTSDCAGDGRCDCVGVCAITPRAEGLCVPIGDCRAEPCGEAGQVCCDVPAASALGRCVDATCAGCCI